VIHWPLAMSRLQRLPCLHPRGGRQHRSDGAPAGGVVARRHGLRVRGGRVSAVGVRHAGATTASRPSMSRVRRAVGRTA